ncbi:MAG: hypothetical protein HEQ23_16715 [Tepidisphaera sp.]|jgi:hypothetical protein
MQQRRLRPTLIAINGVLALLVAGAFATAQPAAQPRLRGEYTMVAGRTSASGKDAIYILDVTNREIIALRWENSRRSLVGIGYRSLDADSALPPAR